MKTKNLCSWATDADFYILLHSPVMTLKEKVRGALAATKSLGIPDEEVKPILRHLLRLYDKNWELIEQENYRALVDAYFDLKENKVIINFCLLIC